MIKILARLLSKKQRMRAIFIFLLEHMLQNDSEDCSIVISLIVWDRTAKDIEIVKKQDGWYEAALGKKPCEDKNSNVCVAEGCYGEACLKDPPLVEGWIDDQMAKEVFTIKDPKGVTGE